MELDQCINFVLTKTQQSVQQMFKARLAPFGVTPGQYAVLKCLWDGDGKTAKQLADMLYLDGSTMTGILDRVESKGFIQKQVDTKDRRAIRVTLTDSGRALEAPLTQVIHDANQEALANLAHPEGESLRTLLLKLNFGN
ncbi:MAG TPA: MarR family transcriptional regulator [Syntrophomonadaceae bacterium]|nr:MarR family transcriptional regulator [Syntrophomonadaceae bacterium]